MTEALKLRLGPSVKADKFFTQEAKTLEHGEEHSRNLGSLIDEMGFGWYQANVWILLAVFLQLKVPSSRQQQVFQAQYLIDTTLRRNPANHSS